MGGETHTESVRKPSCITRPVVTPALSKTCSSTGATTPPVVASSVEVAGTHHQGSPVRGSPGLRSPLSPPSHSDRGESTTSVGASQLIRSCYLVVATGLLPILLRSCPDPQVLKDSHCPTEHTLPVV